MRVFGDFAELDALVGRELGASQWVEVTQEMIDGFADVTNDHQWIHVDVERARTDSPFGGTIAHGYLSLSLLPQMVYRIYAIENIRQSINYGLNKVRFPCPVRPGDRLRTTLTLLSAERVEPDGVVIGVDVPGTLREEARPHLYRFAAIDGGDPDARSPGIGDALAIR